MNCGVGRRHGSDLALLWLWHGPGSTAPTGPLAWGKKKKKEEQPTGPPSGPPQKWVKKALKKGASAITDPLMSRH